MQWSPTCIGLNPRGWGDRDPQILGWGAQRVAGVVKCYYVLSITRIMSEIHL